MQYLEIGARTYPLRFTARSLMRTQTQSGLSIKTLLNSGAQGACLLLYAALCDALPRLTIRGAQALLESFLKNPAQLDDLLALLAKAYHESGFPPEGITQESFERLLDAAARAGYMHPERLMDLTYAEIVRSLNAFLAHLKIHLGAAQPSAPSMTDEQMKNAIWALSGRLKHGHA